MATFAKAKTTLASGEQIARVYSLTSDGNVLEATAEDAWKALSGTDTTIEALEDAIARIDAGGSAAYGVQFDTSVSSPSCTRLGDADSHKTLPVQSLMKGCLLDDDGNVVEYLDPSDWTSNTRDGSRGQVMVEIPAHYRKFVTDGTVRQVWLSLVALPGYHKVPKMYVSAYQATVQRSTLKLASVVNTDADYRGGNNTSSYDGTYRTQCGRPASNISRTNFRKYARNRGAAGKNGCGWNCYLYEAHKALYWLFVVEYATLNSQASYNAALTSDGYRQGGLGSGVTTWDSTTWTSYAGSTYPFVPCGVTDELGNGTGTVSWTATDGDSISKSFDVPRYRGVENPFGHVWNWTDGVNVQINPDESDGGDGTSKVFACSDPALFSDSGYDGYSHVGNEARASAYAKAHIFGEYGEIVPSTTGGGSTTYLCDYHYTSIPASTALRGLLFGGRASDDAIAGLAYAYSRYAPSSSYAYIGSRLCFLPN